MKINLIQFMAFCASFGWVMGSMFKLDHASCVALALLGFFLAGYLKNAHKILMRKFRS